MIDPDRASDLDGPGARLCVRLMPSWNSRAAGLPGKVDDGFALRNLLWDL
jgi:hypothetical protein